MGKLNQAMTDLMRYNAAIMPQKRSVFNKNHSHATTLDSAYLVPIMWDRVVPGDEKKIRYSGLARMATPIHPVMDEAFLDVWAFYVPDRLWWCHAKEFYGENLDAEFNTDGEYVMPYLKPSQYCVQTNGDFRSNGLGSLNDYFGFPFGDTPNLVEADENPDLYCTAGLHRCYQRIWNEYFRNTSVQPAVLFNDGDTVTESELSEIMKIRKVCKLPDYFTSCLREPQAGEDVILPLGEWAPVVSRNTDVDLEEYYSYGVNGYMDSRDAIRFTNVHPNSPGYDTQGGYLDLGTNVVAYKDGTAYGVSNNTGYTYINPLHPMNLWADLTSASSTTINNLRAAITVQQLLEKDAIAGKFYQRILQAHFGVLTPDSTLSRCELLGASRTNIGMRQVLQTSSTVVDAGGNTTSTPQGNAAAVSVTNVANEWICNKAFTEPGFIMVLAAVRPIHSYSQGIDCLLTKLQRYDHYWPVFDNLGNQPVYAHELCTFFDRPSMMQRDYVFGYKPAWSEYKYKPNRVSGLMRPDAQGTLASWNYSTKFEGIPVLNSDFVSEDERLIDRTIAVPDEPQFLLDSYFEYTDIKSMSVHSTPGLTRL